MLLVRSDSQRAPAVRRTRRGSAGPGPDGRTDATSSHCHQRCGDAVLEGLWRRGKGPQKAGRRISSAAQLPWLEVSRLVQARMAQQVLEGYEQFGHQDSDSESALAQSAENTHVRVTTMCTLCDLFRSHFGQARADLQRAVLALLWRRSMGA